MLYPLSHGYVINDSSACILLESASGQFSPTVSKNGKLRRPGIEPGSKRWQRSIITTRPSALTCTPAETANNPASRDVCCTVGLKQRSPPTSICVCTACCFVCPSLHLNYPVHVIQPTHTYISYRILFLFFIRKRLLRMGSLSTH